MFDNWKEVYKYLEMNQKNNPNDGKEDSEKKKKKQNPKLLPTKQTPKQSKQESSPNPKTSPNQPKTNPKTDNKKPKSDDKKKEKENKNEDKTKTKKDSTIKSEGNKPKEKKKDPKLEVVKPNLKKTDKKTLSPIKELELNVEKIKKLENSGYKQLKPIGQGSYGKVFTAKSTKHKKQVAIKAVDLQRLSELFKKKFLAVEIELLKKMTDHKNVVKMYEIIEATDDHLLYITMEFCPNGDLFDYIIKRHYIPEREACLWFKQLIDGVQHIHKNGFAHRDLKCENILIDSKYNIKIIDFGFCCKIKYNNISKEDKNNSTSNGEIPSQTYCGSVIYASPELLRGHPYLPTMTDIWSCGVILYVMLFGSYPNDGTELERFIQKEEHCIEAPESPQVSNECKDLVKNILVDEVNRYSINEIKGSEWHQKKWEPIDNKISTKEYFENLNIHRVETLQFEYAVPAQPVDSDVGNSSDVSTKNDSTKP